MAFPNLSGLSLVHAPSVLVEDTETMPERWDKLFEKLHDEKLPSKLFDRIRNEATPLPDPVPELTFRDMYNLKGGHQYKDDVFSKVFQQATVSMNLDTDGNTKASVTMIAPTPPPESMPGILYQLEFQVLLPESTDAAKALRKYWAVYGMQAKRGQEQFTLTTAMHPPNALLFRFKRPGLFVDNDKVLHMLATACPMIFGTALAMLREDYVSMTTREDYARLMPQMRYVKIAAQKLEIMWKAWTRTLQHMPVTYGVDRDDSWKAERADEIGAGPVRERVKRELDLYHQANNKLARS